MNQNKFFIGLLLFSFVLLCVLFAYIHKYNSKPQEINIEEQQTQQPSAIKDYKPYGELLLSGQSFEDFDFTKYDVAEKKFTISGKKINLESKKMGLFKIGALKEAQVKEAHITLYEKDAPVSYISAKKAILNISYNKAGSIETMTDKISFFGDISLVTQDRRTLVCDNLILNNKDERISASGNCVLKYDAKTIKADKIDSDVKLQNFNCNKDKTKRLKAITRMLF